MVDRHRPVIDRRPQITDPSDHHRRRSRSVPIKDRYYEPGASQVRVLQGAPLGSALAPDFVTEGRRVIFGKTHLAVAIAYRAIQNGFDARFVTVAELLDELSAAFRGRRLAEALTTYLHPGVLVVDEVGYLVWCNRRSRRWRTIGDRRNGQGMP